MNTTEYLAFGKTLLARLYQKVKVHIVLTRIVLMNQIVHLNTVNRIVHAWTITSLKSRCLLGFLKPGYGTKNYERQHGSIHIVLSQNFHQSSKGNTVWPILSSQGFFIDFHQKLIFYFCFKHLLKNLNQEKFGLTHIVLLRHWISL